MTIVVPETAKLNQLLADLTQVNARLQEALALEPNRIHKDATIQRFEFTMELAWKTMQAASRYIGEEVLSPRDAIRTAARTELITDAEVWLTMLAARNLTAHVYRESVADEVYEQAKKLPPLIEDLISRVRKRMQ